MNSSRLSSKIVKVNVILFNGKSFRNKKAQHLIEYHGLIRVEATNMPGKKQTTRTFNIMILLFF